MRHYEVTFIVDPVLSGDEVKSAAEHVIADLQHLGATVVAVDEMGLRQLAYPINKIHKAHYVLMNVEASNDAMEELTTTFRYNDAVIRNLVIRRDEPVTEESFIMKSEKENRERKSRYEERQAADAARAEAVDEDDAADDEQDEE